MYPASPGPTSGSLMWGQMWSPQYPVLTPLSPTQYVVSISNIFVITLIKAVQLVTLGVKHPIFVKLVKLYPKMVKD